MPIIGAVTNGFESDQATATWAILTPRFFAISATLSIISELGLLPGAYDAGAPLVNISDELDLFGIAVHDFREAVKMDCRMSLQEKCMKRWDCSQVGLLSRGLRYGLIISSEEAPGKRRPRDHPDAKILQERRHLTLLFAIDRVVEVLHGDKLS